MMMQQIIETVRSLDGALVLVPEPGSSHPEIAWGDAFCYYAPDGQVPSGQPYATIVTKDYPGDTGSDLDPPGRWRVNIQVDKATFHRLTGEEDPRHPAPRDFAESDVVLPHPVYGAIGWIAVVNPADRTGDLVLGLLRRAHADARARHDRRDAVTGR